MNIGKIMLMNALFFVFAFAEYGDFSRTAVLFFMDFFFWGISFLFFVAVLVSAAVVYRSPIFLVLCILFICVKLGLDYAMVGEFFGPDKLLATDKGKL